MDRTFFINAPKFIEDEKPNWAKPVTYRRQAPKPLSKRGKRVLDGAFLKMVAEKRLNKYERRAMNRDLNRNML